MKTKIRKKNLIFEKQMKHNSSKSINFKPHPILLPAPTPSSLSPMQSDNIRTEIVSETLRFARRYTILHERISKAFAKRQITAGTIYKTTRFSKSSPPSSSQICDCLGVQNSNDEDVRKEERINQDISEHPCFFAFALDLEPSPGRKPGPRAFFSPEIESKF